MSYCAYFSLYRNTVYQPSGIHKPILLYLSLGPLLFVNDDTIRIITSKGQFKSPKRDFTHSMNTSNEKDQDDGLCGVWRVIKSACRDFCCGLESGVAKDERQRRADVGPAGGDGGDGAVHGGGGSAADGGGGGGGDGGGDGGGE
ncbi:hypothetical protein BDQ17DRAFT_1330227 [Cyathus striatus]|nr:hypothetical protein BDQ17DRAFT_1330227 [Cyathus striatus]